MSITAAQVKELRERTGVGMMECKKALVEAGGDIDAAIELMRKSGMAKAAKKAGRVAAEGAVIIQTTADNKSGAIVEINSETDFVARDDNFRSFADKVATAAVENQARDVAALMAEKVGENTLEESREQLIAKIGENINVRRVDFLQSADVLGSYVHGDRIGVLVALNGGDESLAKDIAMHIAAMKPQFINPEEVSADLVEKEKEIFTAQAKESGKPDDIIEKMIGGRINKFLAEVSLTGQPFVKDPNVTIGNLLKSNKASVANFICYEVGEGIEKKEENFRDEVMAQVKGTA
jgi:elongation factor Ts